MPEALFLPLALALLAVEGAAPLPDPSSPQTVGWLLLALAAVAGAVNQALGGVVNFRRLKGADQAEASRWATKDEHVALEARVESVERTQASELRDIHRALGRIEGALGTQPATRAAGD